MAGVRKKQELSILTSYSESVFLLASQISIGKKPPVELVRVTGGYVLQCDWPELQMGFDPLYTEIAGALKQYGVNCTGRFWSEPSPVFEVEFESQSFIQTFLTHLQAGDVLESVQSVLLPKAHETWMQANPEMEKPSWEIDISLRLLHVLPNLESKHAIVRRVTHENCSECVYLWNKRMVFDMGALLRWYRSGQERCTNIKGEIKLSVLYHELEEVVGWRELGLYLGLPRHELKVIEKDYARDTKMCKMEMLSEWLHQCEKATWVDVVTALLKSGLQRIARRIADKYDIPFVTNDDQRTFRVGMWNEDEDKASDVPTHKMELEEQSYAMEKMDSHLQDRNAEKGSLEEAIEVDQQKEDIAKQCLNILVKSQSNLQQQVEEKEEQLKGLRDELSRREQTISELRVELAHGNMESKQLKGKLELLTEEKQLLMQSIEVKEEEIVRMRKKVEKVKIKMDTARAELADVEGQLEEKKSQLQEVQEELLHVQAERDELQKSIMEREAAIDEKLQLQQNTVHQPSFNEDEVGSSKVHKPSTGSLPRILPSANPAPEQEWIISEELKQKYTKQFVELKPNNGLLEGEKARNFFVLSKLPNEELSRIWKLADVDKDNALSEEEFCIAMKLVLARRKGYDIPASLPVSLLPGTIKPASFKLDQSSGSFNWTTFEDMSLGFQSFGVKVDQPTSNSSPPMNWIMFGDTALTSHGLQSSYSTAMMEPKFGMVDQPTSNT